MIDGAELFISQWLAKCNATNMNKQREYNIFHYFSSIEFFSRNIHKAEEDFGQLTGMAYSDGLCFAFWG